MIGSWKATTPSPGDLPPSSQLAAPPMPGRHGQRGHELVEAVDGLLLEGDDDEVAALGGLQRPRQRVGVREVLVERLGLRAALDLDVDRRVREGAQDLLQRRDAEVGGGEALRRLALAGRDAAQAIGRARAVVAVGVAAAGEPVGGVELAQLRQRERRDGAVAVGRAVDRRVVHDDDLAVLGHPDVELEHVGADLQRALERVHRVGRELVLAALVGDVERRLLDPRVRRGAAAAGAADEQRDDARAGRASRHRVLDGPEPLDLDAHHVAAAQEARRIEVHARRRSACR